MSIVMEELAQLHTATQTALDAAAYIATVAGFVVVPERPATCADTCPVARTCTDAHSWVCAKCFPLSGMEVQPRTRAQRAAEDARFRARRPVDYVGGSEQRERMRALARAIVLGEHDALRLVAGSTEYSLAAADPDQQPKEPRTKAKALASHDYSALDLALRGIHPQRVITRSPGHVPSEALVPLVVHSDREWKVLSQAGREELAFGEGDGHAYTDNEGTDRHVRWMPDADSFTSDGYGSAESIGREDPGIEAILRDEFPAAF